jgi:hypothetical protein
MTFLILVSVAVIVFIYTITAIVLSQEISAFITEISSSTFLGSLSAFITGVILIVGAAYISVITLKKRFTRL